MKYFIVLISLFSFGHSIAQNEFKNTKKIETDQEAYSEEPKKFKLMIVPFDYKMYMSSLDREIAAKTRLTFPQIRDNMRYGLAKQILLETKGSHPAISLIESDSSYDDLKYIYNSIGYKYKLVPIKEEVNVETDTKVDKLKNSLTKLVNKKQSASQPRNREYNSGKINNGQVESYDNPGERYMHTSIHNPNLIPTLQLKYQTNLYIFINELDIEEVKSKESSRINTLNSTRRIKVHYTIIDEKSNDVYGSSATTEIPSYISDMNKIINIYFKKIAEQICASVPSVEINKNEAAKQKSDQKKADIQRDQILNY
jgi:hypothetical protein